MKTSDLKYITSALIDLRRLKWLEDNEGGSDFQRGVAATAETMIELLTNRGNSYAYSSALHTLAAKGKAAREQVKHQYTTLPPVPAAPWECPSTSAE